MYPSSIKLPLLFLIVNLFHQGASLMCYNCSSVENVNCGKYFNRLEVNQVECDSNKGCVKIKHSTVGSGPEPISRACYDESMRTPNEVCIVCKSDLCNSSFNILPSLLTVVSIWILCENL